MKVGEHRDDSDAVGGGVLAIVTRLSVHQWEQRNAVPWTHSTQRLATARGSRCDDKVEAAAAECSGGVECALKPLERRFSRVPEPGLALEVIDRDEATRSAAIAYDPVVAADSEGRVVRSFQVEAPAVSQRISQRAGVDLLWQRFHFSCSKLTPAQSFPPCHTRGTTRRKGGPLGCPPGPAPARA
jgi:hypothetical protein